MPQNQEKTNVIHFQGARVKADTDNGYTRIAHDLVEALAMAELSGGQFRAVLAIIRKTYGYNRKSEWLSSSQIAEAMGKDHRDANVRRDIKELKRRNIIKQFGREVGPNPVISEWAFEKPSRTKTSPKTDENVTTQNGRKRHQNGDENNTRADENITKMVTKTTPTIDKRKDKRKEKRKAPELPAFIDPDKFAAFVDMRKQIKKPLTDHAITLAVAKLEKFHNDGHDANHIIDETVLNGWQGFWPPKPEKQASPFQSRNEQEINAWLAEGSQ